VDTGPDIDLDAIPLLGPDAPTTRIRGHSGGTDAAHRRSSVLSDTAARARAHSAGMGRHWARLIGRGAPVILPLLVLGGLALYVLNGLVNPTATLTLHPRADIITAGTTAQAVLNLPFAQRGPQRLAMATISQAEEHTVPVPVRGMKILPGHVATGRLALANLTTRPLVVPAGPPVNAARHDVYDRPQPRQLRQYGQHHPAGGDSNVLRGTLWHRRRAHPGSARRHLW
jgi:hypothetical protein